MHHSMQHTQTHLKLQATVVFQRLACLSSFCLIEGLKYLKGEAIAGCRDKKLSEMIHMIALSTVIGRLIFSLYPECNKNTRPLCRKDILPRDYDISANTAMILWSKDNNLDNRPGS
ncbi:unnamed protein product [Pocillopora meandrina]|uniref:Uncharacterized protein n=1 Tax=Pocillopora meandrina TaxID=46732 RepID=A0AAU9X4C4_9CNID|nr:unnamed protein product [Pocillopora meandrina]